MTVETKQQQLDGDVSLSSNLAAGSLPEAPKAGTTPEHDHIGPAEHPESRILTTHIVVVENEPLSPSKKDNVQVQVSRRSTETGDSKVSQRRFGIIRWPSNKNNLEPGIHWYTPTMMVLLGLAGLFGGLGHHLYNSRLKGQPVGNDAQWPQRWGVAMAFFVKMTLVGAVQIAVKQRAWVSICQYQFPCAATDPSLVAYREEEGVQSQNT